ncbi:MAG: hypothetical protein MZV70_65545 [Desulfobacterales bacterium]|nr:hypothetical protein [Desulfobacterales bacterium]
MIDEVLIAGFGGQGIMLMGKLLAYGAIYEGLEVTFYPSLRPGNARRHRQLHGGGFRPSGSAHRCATTSAISWR